MEAIAVISLFLVLFGISYLYFSTRNKERMALIEKGADASIFVKSKRGHASPFWKILILNIALLAMGIGSGIVIGGSLEHQLNSGIPFDDFRNRIDFVMPGMIFLMAGAGLLIGFFITKKMDKED